MFSSDTDDWATPIDFFKKLDLKYKFTLDVCASEKNHKAPLFFDREQNGLIQNWGGAGVLDESPLRQRNRLVDAQGLRERKTTEYCCRVFGARPNRYGMVA
jgi:hypothetical protein